MQADFHHGLLAPPAHGTDPRTCYRLTSVGESERDIVTDGMRPLISSIEAEYRRYKALGEGAIAQLGDADLSAPGPNRGNSIAVVVWHFCGNLASRFTDFLTSDGEKPWRHREEEFAARTVTRDVLMEKWRQGWSVLFEALEGLSDDHLEQRVTIRGQSLAVHEALHRSLAHTSYHIGQVVYLAKLQRGVEWRSLSIPLGASAAYNRNPTRDRPDGHAAELDDASDDE